MFEVQKIEKVLKDRDEIIDSLSQRCTSLEQKNGNLRKENDLLKHTIRTFENEEIKQRVIDHIKGLDPNNLVGRMIISSDASPEGVEQLLEEGLYPGKIHLYSR